MGGGVGGQIGGCIVGWEVFSSVVRTVLKYGSARVVRHVVATLGCVFLNAILRIYSISRVVCGGALCICICSWGLRSAH